MFRPFIFSLLISTLIVCKCYAQDEETEDVAAIEEENDVLILTDENFDEAVKDHKVVLLEFYAPWCGHCKSFAPEYEKIATALKKENIPVAKIDAIENKEVAGRYDVSGYPTVIILKDGEPTKYSGARTEQALVAKVLELADPNWKPPPEAVITLTEANFDEVVDNANIILVEFYAPWCGHCKKLAPEYEEAAQELKNLEVPIPLAKVDATEESALAQRFSVSGYPTLKLFRKGQDYEYQGGRDKSAIVSYMIQQSSPPSVLLADLKSTKNLLHQSEDITIIGFFDNEDDPRLLKFQAAANNIREDFTFKHTFDRSIADHLHADMGSVMIFHSELFQSKYEPNYHKLQLESDSEISEIEEFINAHSIPLVGQRTPGNARKRYTKRPMVVVYYAVDFSFDYRKNTQIWRRKVLEVANQFKDITFAISNEDDFEDDLQKADLGDSSEDINVIAYDKDEKRYRMEPSEEFDEEVLEEFVRDFTDGKIEPKYKSAPAPKKNNGPVKVVVAKTFDSIVLDDTKDVLIEFYAPWCGHCKKLEPIYKKLGKKFKEEGDLIIAKMDATANDIPHPAYKADGFPTLYWSAKNSKDTPQKYEGGRELDELVAYLNKERTGSKDEL